jgi:hypothetical protein
MPKLIRAAVIAPPAVVHEHLIPFPHDDPLVVWVAFSQLKHHISLVLGLEAGLVPVVEALVFFGVSAQSAVLDFVVEVGTMHANLFVVWNVLV